MSKENNPSEFITEELAREIREYCDKIQGVERPFLVLPDDKPEYININQDELYYRSLRDKLAIELYLKGTKLGNAINQANNVVKLLKEKGL
jgi:hypothetical protein